MSSVLRRVLPLLLLVALAACLPTFSATSSPASTSPAAGTAYPLPTTATATAYPLPETPAIATAYPLPTEEGAYPPPETPGVATAYPPPATPAAATAYPLPTEAYPAPDVVATAYPAPQEDDTTATAAIAILQWQTDRDGQVRVSGTSTLPDGACILTMLVINEASATWWPAEQCAAVREGQWVLTFQRSPLGPSDPPGASYVLTAYAPDYPEAGEAHYQIQSYIPYTGGGN